MSITPNRKPFKRRYGTSLKPKHSFNSSTDHVHTNARNSTIHEVDLLLVGQDAS